MANVTNFEELLITAVENTITNGGGSLPSRSSVSSDQEYRIALLQAIATTSLDWKIVPFYSAISGSSALSATANGAYFIDCSGGDVVLTIPSAATATNNREHLIKRIDTSANTLTLSRSGSDLIDNEVSQTLASLESIYIRSDGTSNWWVY